MIAPVGRVYLVGAGPGEPGLITVKGLERLREADVIVYDRLVDRRLLKESKQSAELVYAGKDPGSNETRQRNIYTLMIDAAREGKRVVRLKGGDPFVFGRGGEEAQVLAMAEIPFEVVPGVTSAVAAPAYAGIPLTHREAASSFTVVSAVEDPDKGPPATRWDALARTGGTLVILMGWAALPTVTARLAREGMRPSTPAAVVQWGTEPRQRTVTGTLANIAERCLEAGLGPPVVVVIGPVARLRREIRWFEDAPLFGKRALVTRSRPQASSLSRLLSEEGACPVEVPAIRIAPPEDWSDLDKAIDRLASYRWAAFTSVNGVDAFFQRMAAKGLDARALSGARVCAIGPATASALVSRGIRPDFVPSQYTSRGLTEGFRDAGSNGSTVLMPRADIAPDNAAAELRSLGFAVDQPIAYRTLTPEGSREKAQAALARGKIDVVTFTSSSTVRNLVNLLDGNTGLLDGPLIACIGPVTAQTAREMGLSVGVVARHHTVKGLVEALKSHFAPHEGG